MQSGDPDAYAPADEFAVVTPRVTRTLKGSDRLGGRTVELAREAGLSLDDWQEHVLVESMRVGRDGRWSAVESGTCVARQNGKGEIILARLLGSLAVVESDLSIYSAHLFDTSLEHFRRLEYAIEDTSSLRKQLKGGSRGFKHSHGEEGVEFTGGRRVRFKTRTKAGGRGLACDGVLVLDEAMVISEWSHGAVFPIMSAKTLEKPGPQVWYMGSAVDQLVHEHGVVFARVRERGMGERGSAARLVWFEWSVEGDNPSKVPEETLHDRAAWAQANPALGIRINPEYIHETEIESMDSRNFAVERLGVGDWPRTDFEAERIISPSEWAELVAPDSVLDEPVFLAFDVSPERRTSIAAAGMSSVGGYHVEIGVDQDKTFGIVAKLVELNQKLRPKAIVCDGYGPAASLIPKLQEAGVDVTTYTAGEYTQACGRFVDLVREKQLRHLGSTELAAAIRNSRTRPLGDSWAWSRKNSEGNIAPLVAATLAVDAAVVGVGSSVYDEREMIAL